MTDDKILEFASALSEPFSPSEIDWRVGATNRMDPDRPVGIPLAYVTARAVQDRLDEVAGPDGWCHALTDLGAKGFKCRLGVRFHVATDLEHDEDVWIYHEDVADESDIEKVKGSASGALKRAAVHFGIARYLYWLPTTFVPIRAAGKSFKLVSTPTLPAWALPGGSGRPGKPQKPAQRIPLPNMADEVVKAHQAPGPFPEGESPFGEEESPFGNPWRGEQQEAALSDAKPTAKMLAEQRPDQFGWLLKNLPKGGPAKALWNSYPGRVPSPPTWAWVCEGAKDGKRRETLVWASGKLADDIRDGKIEGKWRANAEDQVCHMKDCLRWIDCGEFSLMSAEETPF